MLKSLEGWLIADWRWVAIHAYSSLICLLVSVLNRRDVRIDYPTGVDLSVKHVTQQTRDFSDRILGELTQGVVAGVVRLGVAETMAHTVLPRLVTNLGV